jgi:hypothetical protein
MPDAAWWSAQGQTSQSCKPRPRERLWTLTKNGKQIDAELLFHAEHGVEIQFLHEGVMAYGRRWTLRAEALDQAGQKRIELQRQGWGGEHTGRRTAMGRESGDRSRARTGDTCGTPWSQGPDCERAREDVSDSVRSLREGPKSRAAVFHRQ